MNRELFLNIAVDMQMDDRNWIETDRQMRTATAAARLPVGICSAWMGGAAGFPNNPLNPEHLFIIFDKSVPGG